MRRAPPNCAPSPGPSSALGSRRPACLPAAPACRGSSVRLLRRCASQRAVAGPVQQPTGVVLWVSSSSPALFLAPLTEQELANTRRQLAAQGEQLERLRYELAASRYGLD